jgi:hypothetical protein
MAAALRYPTDEAGRTHPTVVDQAWVGPSSVDHRCLPSRKRDEHELLHVLPHWTLEPSLRLNLRKLSLLPCSQRLGKQPICFRIMFLPRLCLR